MSVPFMATLIFGNEILVGPLIAAPSLVGSNCAPWHGQISKLLFAS